MPAAGIDRTLDLVQEAAAVNVVMSYSHGYNNAFVNPLHARADHGVPLTDTACWNHPEYVGFWADTMEDLFRSHDLDGIQWGAERQGPLMNVVSPWDGRAPTCFCEFCVARVRGDARGEPAGVRARGARGGAGALTSAGGRPRVVRGSPGRGCAGARAGLAWESDTCAPRIHR